MYHLPSTRTLELKLLSPARSSWTTEQWTTQYTLQFFFHINSFSFLVMQLFICEEIIIIIYPLIARIVGAPQMTSQPVSSIFPCPPLPSGTWRTPGLSIPSCCLPTYSSACLVFFPFHCALQDGFGQTWWTGDMSISLQFASLYDGQVFVWSVCLLDLGMDVLIGNMVFAWDA